MTNPAAHHGLSWRQLHWQRPVETEQVLAVIRQMAADQRSPLLVLEARATDAGIRYLLGTPPVATNDITRLLGSLATATEVDDQILG